MAGGASGSRFARDPRSSRIAGAHIRGREPRGLRPLTPGLVLAGGGHAHVEVLRHLAQRRISALRVTLVSSEPHAPYSGMLPGLIAGHYSWPDCHIDLAALCGRAGARLVIGRVVGVDLKARVLLLEGADPLPWDLLSLNTGSTPSLSSVEGAFRFAIPIKPMSGFLSALQRMIETRESSPPSAAGRGGGGGRCGWRGGGAGSATSAPWTRRRLAPGNPGRGATPRRVSTARRSFGPSRPGRGAR